MVDGIVYKTKTTPLAVDAVTLGEIAERNVNEHFYLNNVEISKFNYLRGSKEIPNSTFG